MKEKQCKVEALWQCLFCTQDSVCVRDKEFELKENNRYHQRYSRFELWHVCHNQLWNLYGMHVYVHACVRAKRLNVVYS